MSSKNSTVEKFINSVKRKYNLRTDSDVAKLFKVSRQALHFWRAKESVPSKYIHLVENDLIPTTFENDPKKFKLPDDATIAQAETRRLPVIGLAAAGPNLFTDNDFRDPEETASCPAGLHDPKAFWVPIVGNSMRPYLLPGMRVCVSPNIECKSGSRSLIGLTDGQKFIAEMKFNNGTVEMIKYNADSFTVNTDQIEFCYPIVYIREPK